MKRSCTTNPERRCADERDPVRVAVALVVGLALLAMALGVTLSGSPVAVLRTNRTPAFQIVAQTYKSAKACQAGEVVPAGTSAIRLSLESVAGPEVSVSALSGTHLLTSGVAGSGWTGAAVTVPVKPVARTTSHVQICFKLGKSKELVVIDGAPAGRAMAATDEGQLLGGRVRIEDLRASHSSWWSLASTVARRMGLGHAPSGTWTVLLLLALMGAAVATASWLTLKEL
jgi:hypothetical protein